jgi:hypothetical protein
MMASTKKSRPIELIDSLEVKNARIHKMFGIPITNKNRLENSKINHCTARFQD